MMTYGAEPSHHTFLQSQYIRILRHYTNFIKQGVPAPALKRSLKFYSQAIGRTLSVRTSSHQEKSLQYSNDRYLVIIDYSVPSTKKRFYLLDLKNGTVEKHYAAHGLNTGGTKAYRFSNILNSKQTSLGFYLTGALYHGKFGPALKMYGLEPSNDRAFERYIVMHGAWYVSPEFIAENGYLGRSHGCPALEMDVAAQILPRLQVGTLVYAYHHELAYKATVSADLIQSQDPDAENDNPTPTWEELLQLSK